MQSPVEPSLDANYHQCVDQLTLALRQLGAKVSERQVAQIADLIIQTMTGAWRFFHTPGHIFDVGRTGDAIEVLAALFHDAIHVQADNGVRVNVGFLVAPFVREVGESLTILPATALPDDPVFEVVSEIFSFSPGQVMLPFKGQNEFLSALVAGKCLQGALGLSEIAQITACIEATIPFRAPTAQGKRPSEFLRARLEKVNQGHALGWDAATMDGIVRRAVRLANRDVENFAHEEPAEFLNNTWNLMPETNHDLLGTYSYTVSGFRKSLQKMEAFMSGLDAHVVFQQFQTEPPPEKYAVMLAHTTRNLETAKLYLGSKLLSIALIEAVSLRVGNDMPLATIMGELPQHGSSDAQLESFLPQIKKPKRIRKGLESEVMELLEKGRTQESAYDVKHSPVGTFVIKTIGFDNAMLLLKEARKFFSGNLSSEAFLSACDSAMVEAIVRAVERVFEIRLRSLRI